MNPLIFLGIGGLERDLAAVNIIVHKSFPSPLLLLLFFSQVGGSDDI